MRRESTVMRGRHIVITRDDMARLRELVRQGRKVSRRDQDHLTELDQELDRAEIIGAESLSPDIVTMHSTVRVRDLDTGASRVYTLVFPTEADKLTTAGVGAAVLGGEGHPNTLRLRRLNGGVGCSGAQPRAGRSTARSDDEGPPRGVSLPRAAALLPACAGLARARCRARSAPPAKSRRMLAPFALTTN